MAAQSKLAGALSRNPKLERVSPGVYRNPKGDLVNPSGRVLPRPAPQPQQTDYQSIVNRYQPMQRPGENQYPQNISPELIDAMNRALEAAGQAQPPPNLPMQPWEQNQNPGPRPAMQTPYDRWKFANQQNNPPFQQQQDWLERMIQQNPPVNYPGSNMQPPDMRLIQPIGNMPTGPLRPSYGNNGNSNNPGASAPAQRPRFRI